MTLERELRALGDGLPDPPDLSARVLVAMREASAQRRRRRVAVLALAVFLLAPATALAFSPDLRDRVLETFGLRGVTVDRVAHIPTVSPAARNLQLGSRISLTQARSVLAVRFHSPKVLGAPDGDLRGSARRRASTSRSCTSPARLQGASGCASGCS